MSVWEVIAVYAVLPAAIVAFLAVVTVGRGRRRVKVRYEPGKPWQHPDRLWAGVTPVVAAPVVDRVGTTRGGAHAGW